MTAPDISGLGMEYIFNQFTNYVSGSAVITGAFILFIVFLLCKALGLEFSDTSLMLVLTAIGLFLHSLAGASIVIVSLIIVGMLVFFSYRAMTERV